ncbi:MAG: HemK2/MTQ2 family protein methyltransferase [Nitrososphaerales archaeon]
MTKAYRPREDSLLLRDVVEPISANLALEIGCGVGFVLESLAQRCAFVVGVDVDKSSLSQAKLRLKAKGLTNFELLCASSAEPFISEVFDLIVFNPPYLPSLTIEDRAVDGGYRGVEVSLQWLKECKRVVKVDGKVLFISSSLASQDELIKGAEALRFKIKLVDSKHLFYEDLYAYELTFGYDV